MIEEEEWVPISMIGVPKNKYFVLPNGKIKGPGGILKKSKSDSVCLYTENGKRKKRRIRDIMCTTFYGERPSPSHKVGYINRNLKTKNHAVNLRWVKTYPSKYCIIKDCFTGPCFGPPGGKSITCGKHKKDSYINLHGKLCEEKGCKRRPHFGHAGEQPSRCSEHKLPGHTNITAKKCNFKGCDLIASFGILGQKAVTCLEHSEDEYVNLMIKLCTFKGCDVTAGFGIPGKGAMTCSEHKKDGYVNSSKLCNSEGCNVTAGFGIPGKKSMTCSKHKKEGYVNSSSKICNSEGCDIVACFGTHKGKPLRCREHNIEGDWDVRSIRCSSESCLCLPFRERGYANCFNKETQKRDLCTTCHRVLFPGEHNRFTASKEQFILAEIQRQIPELEEYFHSWDCPLNGCSTKRPDMAYYIYDTFLHIEIDEGGLSHEDCEDRLKELRFASQKKNHDLIRFNPDKTSDGDDECLKRSIQKYGDLIYRKNNSEWDKRIPVLIKCIRDAFERALLNADVDSFYRKQKLFF